MNCILIRLYLLKLAFILTVSGLSAQISPFADFTNEQLGSIYYAYPKPAENLTPPPEGFEPFYISHYGRHGSRWITSDDRYTKIIEVFENHKLTPLGEDVRKRLHNIWNDTDGRSGDLTPLGEQQQKQIAERMYRNYQPVFQDNTIISARSSIVTRCIMSMSAFCERLKELNPTLQITREANKRYMNYIAYTSPEAEEFSSENTEWRKDFYRFESEHIKPQRLLASLFKHPEEIREPYNLMIGIYWIASDIQNTDLQISLYDIFDKQELFNIWQCVNYRMYVCNAGSPLNKGVMPRSATSLLKNIIESADEAVSKQKTSVTLRFGHDTNLIRLLTLMKIEGCYNKETDSSKYYQAWQDFRVSPMAANLQLIFFRNKQGEVIIKILHNETEVKLPIHSEIIPYYSWKDVRDLYSKQLNAPN